MTLIEVFDHLIGRRVSRINFTDKSFVECPEPALVDWSGANTPAELWLSVSEDGLFLHFNAKLVSPRSVGGSMQGQTESLTNITSVV